jgi:uncharacterized repeat protein (TIGR03803 family)
MRRVSAKNKVIVALASATALAAAVSSADAQPFKVIYSFSGGVDGGNPVNGLTMGEAGALFGTTTAGGTSGNGVVFRMNGNGTETVLHSFAGGSADGATPNGGLLKTGATIYGTTTAGGASGQGTVFKLVGTTETVLYSFAGGNDGAVPQSGLVMDAGGNLYGTTNQGGPAGTGTVYELVAPSHPNGTWKEKVLYAFGASPDGANPIGSVAFDAKGNLYGTTSAGGANGYGTIFELKASKWTETTLHDFQNGNDGGTPYAGIVGDMKGNLYGAATQGGVNGGGTTFQLTPAGNGWNFNVLASQPGWGISGDERNVLVDSAGNVYGTTHCDGTNSAGTIYEISPSGNGWNYSLLYTFNGGGDGVYSISNLVMKNGKLFGTTIYGGAHSAGDVFEITP